MLQANEKSNEINLSDTTGKVEDVLLSFPASTPKKYYPADGKIPAMYLLSVGDHCIQISFDDTSLKILTTKNNELDGLHVYYDTKTKEGLLEVYQNGELRCDEEIDGSQDKFMINIFSDPLQKTNNTMTFETWNRPFDNSRPQKDGPQATHDLNKGRLSFHIEKGGNRTYLNNIFPDKYYTFSVVTTDILTTHFLDTAYKNGRKEEKTLAFVKGGNFLGGSKKVYQDGRLISSGGLAQDETDHGPVNVYDETGKKTEYEYYHGRCVANWTRRKKIAKWIGGLAIAGALVYATASANTPEKIDTQIPTAVKKLNAQDNQHI